MKNVRPRDLVVARKLRKAGFRNSLRIIWEARRVGLPLSYAMASLEKESAKGLNVFGHDPVKNPIKGGPVTESRYRAYKRYRQQGLGMQGVGPMQLTYYTIQDDADHQGGCWKPAINMRVGFKLIKTLIDQHHGRIHEAIKAYNGVGPAAEAYADDWAKKQAHWHKYLG